MVLSDNLVYFFKKILPPIGLLIFTFFIYYPTLIFCFIFDDLPTITENIHSRKIDCGGQFFQNPRWISRLLNQFTFVHWKSNPWAYRIFNISLHLATGLLMFLFLFLVLRQHKKNKFVHQNAYLISLLAMALFLLHPVQTQTVTYITQMRLEGLVAFFFFAVLLCFVVGAYTKRYLLKCLMYGLSLLLAAFAAGTKEIAIVLPFITVAVDWFFVAQGDFNNFKIRIPIHLLCLLIIFGLFFSYGYLVPRNITSILVTPVRNNRGNILTPTHQDCITTYYYLISQFKVVLHYIYIFLFPLNLCFDYDYKLSTGFFNFDVLAPIFVLASIVCWAAIRLWRNLADLGTFGILWFFILILPRASFFISTELVCDYKTYSASFGLLFLIAFIFAKGFHYFAKILNNTKYIYMQPTGFVVLVFVLGLSSKIRTNVWSSDLLFWKDASEKSGKARCYNNYANAYADLGDIKNAMHYYEEAIKRDNFYAEPHINLGLMYQRLNQDEIAFWHYKRALEIGEGHPELFNNLGILNMKHYAYEEAEICFKKALALRPNYSSALVNLSKLCHFHGKTLDATTFFKFASKYA
ncbi:MAG: Tetratricopeptide TPR_1 repeat-containing protein [candidate division TM6 bacterium GW2011_GWF2_37_49]|nr:MAG: Tetratricopeptide TPR_1 repeat-containing protein [candidate division TM6 bacterium GW2011_GWF2_37_49]